MTRTNQALSHSAGPAASDEISTPATGLKPPMSLEQFQDDVTNVFLHYVHIICHMTDAKTAWTITKAAPLESSAEWALCAPERDAAEIGLTHAHIEDTEFAKVMREMYDFAYFGLKNLGGSGLEYEGSAMWFSSMLIDAAYGDFSREWDSYGPTVQEHAKRLLAVAETANARLTLEGCDEPFHHFAGTNKDSNGSQSDCLDVRQVALLSGMEEMSIRAAANPNRPNALKSFKVGNATRFELSVVKEWLIQKKRHVPITERWIVKDFDLGKSYKFCGAISMGLDTRYRLLGQNQGYAEIDKALNSIHIQVTPGGGMYLEEEAMRDEPLMRKVAEILALPADLLILRIREAFAHQTLKAVEEEMKKLNQ